MASRDFFLFFFKFLLLPLRPAFLFFSFLFFPTFEQCRYAAEGREENGGEDAMVKASYQDLMECRVGYRSRVVLRLSYDFNPLASDRRGQEWN